MSAAVKSVTVSLNWNVYRMLPPADVGNTRLVVADHNRRRLGVDGDGVGAARPCVACRVDVAAGRNRNGTSAPFEAVIGR